VEAKTWQIPVSLRIRQRGATRTETVLLSGADRTLRIGDGVEWIYPNEDGRGYYRWSLPPSLWQALTGPGVSDLSSRERVALVSNAGALLQAGLLGGDEYLRTLHAFASDPEPLVLASVLDALDQVEIALVPPGQESAFAIYVRKTLGPTLERLGASRRDGEDETVSIIRPRLLDWLGGKAGDAAVLDLARERAASYLEDPASVEPALAGVILQLAARDGDRGLFETYRRRVETAQVPADRARFLGALGAFRDPELREEALRYSLQGPLRPNEIFDVGQSVADAPGGQERMFRWMTDNYDAIMKRLPGEFAGFMPYFASGCSEERLQAARVFFAKPEHQAPGTGKQLAKVADQVQDCVGLREREGDTVARYLRDMAQAP
jgi:alanyl aminopeptidase